MGCDRVGPVDIGGVVLYGVAVVTSTGLRLRLTADEWERLFLPVGARVNVDTGHGAGPYFIGSAIYVDPGWQWVDLVTAPPAPRRRDVRRAAGVAGTGAP